MPKIDKRELEILNAYEKGQLKSVATKAELAKFKAAARATGIKDSRAASPGLERWAPQNESLLHRNAECTKN